MLVNKCKDRLRQLLNNPTMLMVVVVGMTLLVMVVSGLIGRLVCAFDLRQPELDGMTILLYIGDDCETYHLSGSSANKLAYDQEADEYTIDVNYYELENKDYSISVVFMINNYYGPAQAYIDGEEVGEKNIYAVDKLRPSRYNVNRRAYSFFTIPLLGPQHCNEYKLVTNYGEYVIRVRFVMQFDEDYPTYWEMSA